MGYHINGGFVASTKNCCALQRKEILSSTDAGSFDVRKAGLYVKDVLKDINFNELQNLYAVESREQTTISAPVSDASFPV